MQSIIRHNHSEMNEFSGLLRIIIYSALDTCPSLGTLTINALAAADEVIITVNPQLLAMIDYYQAWEPPFSHLRATLFLI